MTSLKSQIVPESDLWLMYVDELCSKEFSCQLDKVYFAFVAENATGYVGYSIFLTF